jgi:S-(hydroxymethyl)glutathione dehydrogenase/alcohol dehydrogenase
MRAAVLRQQPGSLVIEEVLIAEPRGGEVLVDVKAAGLCHTDLSYMKATFPGPMPAILGHESAGIVRAVGDAVDYVKPGDHVVCCISSFCGSCRSCLGGRPYLCNVYTVTSRSKGETPRLRAQDGSRIRQFYNLAGFAEQMLVHQNAVVRIDEGMPLEKAALLGCGVLTGTGAVFRTAAVRRGGRVCVIGAGGIGLSAIQAADLAGAEQVIAVDLTDDRLDAAKRFGATHLVNASSVDDVVTTVRHLSGGGVDYSFEAVGRGRTCEQAVEMLDRGGVATVIGMVPDDEPITVSGLDMMRREKRLQGSLMGSNNFRADIPHLIDLYMKGRLYLDELVSAEIPLEEINDAYATVDAGQAKRIVVRF